MFEKLHTIVKKVVADRGGGLSRNTLASEIITHSQKVLQAELPEAPFTASSFARGVLTVTIGHPAVATLVRGATLSVLPRIQKRFPEVTHIKTKIAR